MEVQPRLVSFSVLNWLRNAINDQAVMWYHMITSHHQMIAPLWKVVGRGHALVTMVLSRQYMTLTCTLWHHSQTLSDTSLIARPVVQILKAYSSTSDWILRRQLFVSCTSNSNCDQKVCWCCLLDILQSAGITPCSTLLCSLSSPLHSSLF